MGQQLPYANHLLALDSKRRLQFRALHDVLLLLLQRKRNMTAECVRFCFSIQCLGQSVEFKAVVHK